MRAVNVDELVDLVVGVLDLGNGVCAPVCLLVLTDYWRVVDQDVLL